MPVLDLTDDELAAVIAALKEKLDATATRALRASNLSARRWQSSIRNQRHGPSVGRMMP